MADNFNVLDHWAVSATTVTATGEVAGTDLAVTGLTGAVNPGRFVGVTASGAPASGTFAVGDFVLSQNGQMFVCVTAGSPGTWVTPSDTRNLLTSGEETLARDQASSTTLAITSGDLRLTYFTARKSETTTQTRVISGGTPAGATPTLCRVGLYSIASNGDGTLVASVANDTALFAGASTVYTKSWSSSYAKVAGQRYAYGVIVVTGAATPTFVGVNSVGSITSEATLAPKLAATLASQTDLPGSFTDASLSTGARRFYAAIIP
jgi:hypothetical protein